MKKITNSMWEKIEHNPFNSFKKIGWYDVENNRFQEVARWRNVYTSIGSNYGMLNIWTPLFDAHLFESQGSNRISGGYNKPIANLEGCMYQLKKAVKEELVSPCEFEFVGELNNSSCGSIDSLINELRDYLQKQFKYKLFIVDIC